MKEYEIKLIEWERKQALAKTKLDYIIATKVLEILNSKYVKKHIDKLIELRLKNIDEEFYEGYLSENDIEEDLEKKFYKWS